MDQIQILNLLSDIKTELNLNWDGTIEFLPGKLGMIRLPLVMKCSILICFYFSCSISSGYLIHKCQIERRIRSQQGRKALGEIRLCR